VAGDDPEYGRLPLPPKLSPRRGKTTTARPIPHHERQVRRPHRWLTVTAGVLSLGVLGTSVFGYGYYRKLDSNIKRVDVFNYAADADRPAKAPDKSMNILLVGSDSRDGATPEQLEEFNTTTDGGGLNTDTIMLMHISPSNDVTMVSFPRDSWVKIPGHGEFKINAAFADGEADHKGGGPALLTQTVENLTGVHIDHFIEVGFFQFVNISNAIGGVQVCIATRNHTGAYDTNSGVDLPEGVSTISGAQALAFVRQRYNLPADDYDRIDRQRRFIAAAVRKIKTIRNPATINALFQTITQSLTVDSGLSGQELLNLANRLQNVDLSALEFSTPPVIDPHEPKYLDNGQYVSYVQLDMAKLPAFFANATSNNPVAPAPSNSASPSPNPTPVAPSKITVNVLNGRGTATGASDTRKILTSLGVNVNSIGDTSRTDTTSIRYAPSQVAAAFTLGKAIPGVTMVVDNSLGSTIQLVLGTDNLRIGDPTTSLYVPTLPTTPAPATGPSSGPNSVPVNANNLDCGP